MFTRIICAIICGFIVSFSYADQSEKVEYKEGEVLVRFASKEKGQLRTFSERKSFLNNKLGNVTVKKQYSIVSDLMLVELPASIKTDEAVKTLRGSKDILYVEPNYKIYLMSTFPNDTHFSNLWGLHNIGQTFLDEFGQIIPGIPDADIDAPEAWDIHTGNQNIIVAVLDTGIDYAHPDLSANMWVNHAELIGDPNSDDDSNGYIDDIYGYDFADQNNDPNDYMFHGTHVAGTIGAVGDNGVGVAGVSWNVKLMSVKIFPNYGQESFVSHAIEGIHYAANNGAKILNNSWGGGGYSQALKETIEYVNQNGVLFIAAAGNYRQGETTVDNDIDPFYPASYEIDNIVSVLATDCRDKRPWWSHYGNNTVDIGAPGVDIFSTFPSYMTESMFGLSANYETISGTSMASPHVSGACALVWSMYPHLQARDVKRILLETADQLPSLQGLCVTEGRLNVYRALLAACPVTLELATDIVPPDACVEPDESFSYTLTCSNPTPTDSFDPNYFGPAVSVSVTLYLPEGITCPQGLWSLDPNFTPVPPAPGYDDETHAYTWPAFDLYPGQTEVLELAVQVNSKADPGGLMTARAVLRADNAYTKDTTETPVCCYDTSGIIYVDSRASGNNTGIGWQNAYTDLNRALQRAGRACGAEIRIAQGIYHPGDLLSDSFVIPAGVAVYGGFAGKGPMPDERNPVLYPTLLSGRIGEHLRNDAVVTADDNTLLDGLTVRDGKCGILAQDADVEIRQCILSGHTLDGITHTGTGRTLAVLNCTVDKNGQHGVFTEYSAPHVKNSVLSRNGGQTEVGKAIYIAEPSLTPVIYNNTLTFNFNQAIGYFSSNPNHPHMPDIQNCILWYNNEGDEQVAGFDPDTAAWYSCIQNSTEANYNKNCEPGFAYTYSDDPNVLLNVHLAWDSPCRNAGNPTHTVEDAGLLDMDGEDRVAEGRVDIGADEFNPDCGDVYNPWDLNADGVVNLVEFAKFSRVWLAHDPNDPALTDPNHVDHEYLTDPNSPGYITPASRAAWYPDGNTFNYVATGASQYRIDLADLIFFLEDAPWLWTACWRMDLQSEMMMACFDGGSMRLAGFESQSFEKQTPQEKSIKEKMLGLSSMIIQLENLWLTEPDIQQTIEPDSWNSFMEAVYQNLYDLAIEAAQKK